MRKIFFVLILFLSNMAFIKAETFYSKYSDYSDYTDEYVEESDIISVKKERRYRWYKNIKQLGDYYPFTSNVLDYPEVDVNDYYETDYSDWSINYPGFILYRTIETRDVYEYKDPQPIRYIQFHSLKGGNGFFTITELEIFNNNDLIDYKILNNTSDFAKRLKDGNYNDIDNKIINNSKIIIDLNDYYQVKDIKMKLYLYDTTNQVNQIKAKFTRDSSFNSYSFAELYTLNYFVCNSVTDIKTLAYEAKDYRLFTPKYDINYSLEYPLEKEGRIINQVIQYRYKDTLFRHYRLTKEYLANYYKDNPGDYIKDINIYKDYYSYKKRDKVVIDDDLVFTDYNKKLEDLILETTVNDIKIDTNFNINKNGKYQVKFILPFMSIEKIVTVNILQNEINEINDKLLETEKQLKEKKDLLNSYKEQLTKLKQELEKSKENKEEEKIKEYEAKILVLEQHIEYLIEKINQLDQKRIEYNNKLKCLLEKQKEEKIVKENKKTNYFSNLKLWLWLIILIILLILLIKIIKMKKLSY